MRNRASHSAVTPLCPAGHLPLKGGDRLGVPASQSIERHRRGKFKSELRARQSYYSISPLEGEMSGRTEGGGHAPKHAKVFA
ncbi:Hypothetical protein NGAL_HAMBI2427_38440 [Neorhizobium galegae bv. orientalis]|uniref:Lytic murein transglycosylase n=1 Tax=Neorhizobium galegae bv. orientalis str. HAMBI 540 TaxID=1028800 RepID=A0A068SRW3_NEOGA|nr:Hypothetical protein RG540_CH27770 [Neorhizobium galegae bv. orientalis str. HAMBI 540]CDZ50798.1 Hypothetical protein NGAL_HAMBI2427_38440 [Neorhizobium galegae bv. orientalis]